MDFSISERQRHWRDRVANFMAKHVYPAAETYEKQLEAFGQNRFQVVPVLEELKAKAKADHGQLEGARANAQPGAERPLDHAALARPAPGAR